MFSLFALVLLYTTVCGESIVNTKHKYVDHNNQITSDHIGYEYLAPKTFIPDELVPVQKHHSGVFGPQLISTPSHHPGIQLLLSENALLPALLLSASLGLPTLKHNAVNHQDHPQVNPYVTLLLSQYGRYLPIHAKGTQGLYYYAASNNYHNNKPFGAYKVHEISR